MKEVKEKVGQPGKGLWLRRLGLWDLVIEMALLSMEYKLGWAGSWADHLDDPAWLRRAIAGTWDRLRDADRERVREGFEDWRWTETHLDLQYLAMPRSWALCYILNGKKERILWAGRFVTCCRVLEGRTRTEALGKLDKEIYEFVRWI